MNIPCKNCITLPICKNIVNKYNIKDISTVLTLRNKCSLVIDYSNINDEGVSCGVASSYWIYRMIRIMEYLDDRITTPLFLSKDKKKEV